MTDENVRLAWVTGAANGTGAAIAARLLNDGLRALAIDQDIIVDGGQIACLDNSRMFEGKQE